MGEWRTIDELGGVFVINRDGQVKNTVTGRILKDRVCNGYRRVTLKTNGLKRHRYIHRLLAKAFIPLSNGCNQVNHDNGVKTDCALTNLEWTTNQGNAQHAWDTGLSIVGDRCGEANTNHILTEPEVVAIKERYIGGIGTTALAENYGVDVCTVSDIIHGRSWTHIGLAVEPRRLGFKMTFEQAQMVRDKFAAGGVSKTKLAQEFNVSAAIIGRIIKGTIWKP